MVTQTPGGAVASHPAAPSGTKRRNKPRAIGTAAESAVVTFLRGNGWPSAERRQLRGILDAGDITGTPSIAWEVKGGEAARTASDGLIRLWLDQAETERVNARADVGVLVVVRKGVGPANAGRWHAWLDLAVAAWLSHPGGWVTPPPVPDRIPVRLQLADVCALLRLRGYGSPLAPPVVDVPDPERRLS